MKKSTRALVGLVVIDLLLLLGVYWLVLTAQDGASSNPQEAISTVTSTGGAAIGIVTVILMLAFVHHKRKGN